MGELSGFGNFSDGPEIGNIESAKPNELNEKIDFEKMSDEELLKKFEDPNSGLVGAYMDGSKEFKTRMEGLVYQSQERLEAEKWGMSVEDYQNYKDMQNGGDDSKEKKNPDKKQENPDFRENSDRGSDNTFEREYFDEEKVMSDFDKSESIDGSKYSPERVKEIRSRVDEINTDEIGAFNTHIEPDRVENVITESKEKIKELKGLKDDLEEEQNKLGEMPEGSDYSKEIVTWKQNQNEAKALDEYIGDKIDQLEAVNDQLKRKSE